jgi:hypothetical protein
MMALYDEGHRPPADLAEVALREACRECEAEVHFAWRDERWWATIYHEEACPTLARLRVDPNPAAGHVYARTVGKRVAALGFATGFGELRDYVPDL